MSSQALVKPPQQGKVQFLAIAVTASIEFEITDQEQVGFYTFTADVDWWGTWGQSPIADPDKTELVSGDNQMPGKFVKDQHYTFYIDKASRYAKFQGDTAGRLNWWKS